MTALHPAGSVIGSRLAAVVRLIGGGGLDGAGADGLDVHPPWSPCCSPPAAGYPGDCAVVMLAELHEIECCRQAGRA